MKQTLWLSLLCLLLFGCGNMGSTSFDPSGRTIEEIVTDIDEGNYDKTIGIYETVAHDFCDCLANVDFEPLRQRLDRVEQGILDGGTEEQIQSEEENFQYFMLCSMITMSDKYEGYSVNPGVDSVYAQSSQTCPAIFTDFITVMQRNYPDIDLSEYLPSAQ